MKRSKGYNFKYRKISKNKKNNFIEEFKNLILGEKVLLKIDFSYPKGKPHKRFNGKKGIVLKNLISSSLVKIKFGNKIKKILSNKRHLIRI